MREADDLLELGGDQDDAEAFRGELDEEVVDRLLGADVDAARRLVGEQDAWAAEERPSEQHLLLVPAGQGADRRPVPCSPHLAAVEHGARRTPLRPPADDAGGAEFAEPRERRVLDRERPKTRPSSLRDSGIIASPASRLRRGERPSAPARGSRSRPTRSWTRRRRLAPARCVRRPRGRRGRRSRPRGPRSSLPRRRAREAPDGEQHGSVVRRGLPGRERGGERPAEHRLDQRRLGLRRGGSRLDQLAVPEHRDRVGQGQHLAEEVRDEQDRLPGGGQPRTISCNWCVSCAPSAADGSSMTISWASRESARRISTFCCSAVPSWPAVRRRRARSRRSRRAGRTRLSVSFRITPALRGSTPRKTFSATLSCGTTEGSWAIAATLCSSASRGERTKPGHRRASSCRRRGLSAPAMIFPRVDLPAPFSPTSAWTEPRATETETRSSAWTPPKCLATSRSSR